MDYGKLAYLKAEELESRISVQPRKLPAYAGFAPDVPLRDVVEIAEIKASGAVALVVKLTFSAAGEVSGRITAEIGGAAFSDASVSFSGEKTEVLIGAAEFSGAKTLALRPQNLSGAVLKRAEIVTVGGEGIGREASDFAVAESGTAVLAAYGRNMSVMGCLFSGGEAVMEKELCRGSRFDVCGCGDGFILAHNDAAGNLWLKKYGSDLGETAVLYACKSAESPAVCSSGGRVFLMYIRDGAAYMRTADEALTRISGETETGFGRADAVKFVRGAPSPTAVVGWQEKCRLKFSQPETVREATMGLTAQFSAEGVDD